jgi:bacitracin transport system permease protein
MFKLVRNEFRKFRGSYINTVALLAMLFPALFTSLIYYFTDSFPMEWHNYLNSLHLFYGIFLGSFVPSFVAIFSVFTEFKNGTMKNMIASPYSRLPLIVAKTLYVMLFVIGLYIGVGALVLLSGWIIGLPTVASDIWNVFKLVSLTGMTTIVLVPMMIYLTLMFRNFIAPIVIAFLGTVVGIPIINMGESYFYPWMLPSNFFFRLSNAGDASFAAPLVLFISLILGFAFLSVLRFRRMNFDT